MRWQLTHRQVWPQVRTHVFRDAAQRLEGIQLRSAEREREGLLEKKLLKKISYRLKILHNFLLKQYCTQTQQAFNSYSSINVDTGTHPQGI